jgi:hypothetical protein
MSCKNEEEHEEGGLASLLAHRARKSGHVVARQPHVLARRAHRIDRSGQGWMVCSPDARSLRLPGHQPDDQRQDQAVPGYPLLLESNGS